MATTMLPFKHYFQEARRNPHLNPKVSINQRIKDHLDSARMLQGVGIPNSFVSFTEIEKLGINPQSGYNTPLGIYSYQSVYVMEKAGLEQPMTVLPFVGDAPFANLFRARGKIVNLSRMTKREYENYLDNIVSLYIRLFRLEKGKFESYKESFDDIVFRNAKTQANVNSPGGHFWNTTRLAIESFAEESSQWRMIDNDNPSPVSWNKLFRELGIDGCVDEGDGIIHPSEETQSVFFTKRAIASYERHDNKWSPDSIRAKEKRGRARANILGLINNIKSGKYNPQQLADSIRRNPKHYVDDFGLFTVDAIKLWELVSTMPMVVQTSLFHLLHYQETNHKGRPHYFYYKYLSNVDIEAIKKELKKVGIVEFSDMMAILINSGIVTEDNISSFYDIVFDKNYLANYGTALVRSLPNSVSIFYKSIKDLDVSDIIGFLSGNAYLSFGENFFRSLLISKVPPITKKELFDAYRNKIINYDPRGNKSLQMSKKTLLSMIDSEFKNFA